MSILFLPRLWQTETFAQHCEEDCMQGAWGTEK